MDLGRVEDFLEWVVAWKRNITHYLKDANKIDFYVMLLNMSAVSSPPSRYEQFLGNLMFCVTDISRRC